MWVQTYIDFSMHTEEELEALNMDKLGDIYLNIGIHFTEKHLIKIFTIQIIEDPQSQGEYKLDLDNIHISELE